MGQTLSEPVIEKHSEHGEDERVVYGVSSMQGWRISMEDAHAVALDLKPFNKTPSKGITAGDARLTFFGVYDGHGGDKVAIFTGEHLHQIIAKEEGYKAGNYQKALKDGFLSCDRAILADPKYEDEVSGCTACVCLITPKAVFCGNAGDSRGVLGIKGRAKPLSHDHKPQNDGERARITAAGGFVDFGRVNGNLALSRAIGDFEFKKTAELPPEQQIVTADPDVIQHEFTEDDEFIVLACDGIWDCQSSQAVVEFVRRGIAAKQELSSICENLMDNCLAKTSDTGGVGCDNMTVIIIALLQGKTKEEWYNTVAERVANGDGPCAPPEFAEHRGPGVHHGFDDGAEDFDIHMDMDSRARPFGALGGRIILLGDGSGNGGQSIEVDSDMFDHEDEDRDLESQVTKGTPSGSEDESEAADNEERSLREGTPAPTSSSTDTLSSKRHTGSPSSTQTEHSTGGESKPPVTEEKTPAEEAKAKTAEASVVG